MRERKDNIIASLTDGALHRLLSRAGCIRVGRYTYQELRGNVQFFLQNIIRKSVILMESCNQTTIKLKHVEPNLPTSVFSENASDKKCDTYKSTSKKAGPLKEVEFYQKTGCLLLSKAPFSRLVREFAEEHKKGLRLSEKACIILQYATENFIVKIGEHAAMAAIHAKRRTIKLKDIQLVTRLGIASNERDVTLTVKAPVTAHNLDFGIYIRKVCKQVHPKLKLSSDAVSQLTFIINVLARNISLQAGSVVRLQKKATIGSREVEQATKAVLPSEISKHAVAEGTKAVTKASSLKIQKSSNLVFRVSRCRKFLKECSSQRVSPMAGVYLAAVLEYISAEILELAGYEVQERKKSVIKARDLSQGIKNDEELNSLIGEGCLNLQVAGGGVVPNIHYFFSKDNTPTLKTILSDNIPTPNVEGLM
jgi:histone H3/H4